jgi:3-phenylpropionate/trans-cinnamate dioxygenase ferredoxin reductase subunit
VADRRVDFLLVGGGAAAASCARTLREEGAGGSILVVGREPDPPYERPPLSKGYLAGDSTREDALYLDAGWWEQNDVELLTRTSVMKLDAQERVAKLSSKQQVEFGKALLATGANVRRLRVDGSDLDGIHYLRAFGNADAIRTDAEQAEHVVMVGGSYIGCEVAATLAAAGRSCAVLMQEEVTLERQYGQELGRFVQDGLEQRGVEFVGDDELERFEGADGRVRSLVTRRGRELDADLVVIGAGVAPDAMLARAAGLELGEKGGVACSALLETSAPGIFAAGDAAEFESPLHGGRVLIEHFEVAVAHGRTAARNMLGRDCAHEVVPYFWSDLSDWATLEYVGIGPGEPVVRGSVRDGDFIAFFLAGGRVVGALAVGRSAELDEARRLILERATPSPAELVDAGADLASL